MSPPMLRSNVLMGTFAPLASRRSRKPGFRCTSLGLLADPTLRAHADFMKVLRYDWAHTFLQEGVLGIGAWQLVEAAWRCWILHRVADGVGCVSCR